MTGEPLRLLVVDDTPINLVMLEHLLADEQVLVHTAASGMRALELARENEYALVLLDVQMPGMDGYETARRLKELGPDGEVPPIIFITSIFRDQEYVRRGYEVGAVDYLFRPVDAEILRSKVAVFLDMHRHRKRLKHEIAEHERTSAQLRLAREKYRTIFEKAVEGIFQATLTGDYLEANPAMAAILGHERPEALVGVPGSAAARFHDAEQAAAYLRLLRRHGAVADFEYQVRRADGPVIWVSESARLLRLPDGVEVAEGVLEDVTDRKTQELDLKRRATYDDLTGVPNRAAFFERLEGLAARGRPGRGLLGVLYIDLCDFKQVNDTWGHQVGDDLLRRVAERLRKRLRAGDLMARLGGDEFGVLLEQPGDAASAEALAADLLAVLERPFALKGAEVRVGAAVGICVRPGGDVDPVELVRLADDAMYRAKRRGGGLALAAD